MAILAPCHGLSLDETFFEVNAENILTLNLETISADLMTPIPVEDIQTMFDEGSGS